MISFFEIGTDWPDDFCSITLFARNADVRHTMVYKAPCGEEFLRQFALEQFNPGFLPDAVPNNLGWLIVSARCRSIIEGMGSGISAYFTSFGNIAHPDCPDELAHYSLASNSQIFDCLDLQSAKLQWFDTSKKLAKQFSQLPLLRDRIPGEAQFFGIQRLPTVHVVCGSLRDELVQEQVSGMSFRECEVIS